MNGLVQVTFNKLIYFLVYCLHSTEERQNWRWSYVCLCSLSLVVYAGFPLAQIDGVWLAGIGALCIQFWFAIVIKHSAVKMYSMRKTGEAMLKKYKNQCYNLLTCLKLMPGMDSFERWTRYAMPTTLARNGFFAQVEAEVPKILFYIHPQHSMSRSHSVSRSQGTHIWPVKGTVGFSILNRFIIGFFDGPLCVHLSAKSRSREVKQSLPKLATALSTIEITPSNFRRPTFFFMASVD